MRAHVQRKEVGLARSHRHAHGEVSRDFTAAEGTTQFVVKKNLWNFSRRLSFSLSLTSRLGEIENLTCAQNISMVWLGGESAR